VIEEGEGETEGESQGGKKFRREGKREGRKKEGKERMRGRITWRYGGGGKEEETERRNASVHECERASGWVLMYHTPKPTHNLQYSMNNSQVYLY
jgi:hypothetical protein